MQTYEGSGSIAPLVLTSASLDGGEWSASRQCRFAPGERASGTHKIGGWLDPRAGLDDMEFRRFFCPYRQSNPCRPARRPSLYRLSYPGSIWS
jgi:hypothetical protein